MLKYINKGRDFMTIRDISQKDYDVFMDMCRDFYSGDAVDHAVDENNFKKTFNELTNNNPLIRAFILEVDGECAGYAQLSFTWSNEAGGFTVWLEEIYIKPEFRERKLGTKLLEYIFNEYKNKACRFRLEVSPSNTAAMKLYSRLGFTNLNYLQMIIDK